ncbi:hypothetical protein ALC57_06759 [Trachymyrmex cornetzi]|uniref:Uncharacterized protein n=1 Tax=Trachymyrmex cornetzi TaxID=471704 RepID=A0A195E6P7_9HYME|nr:hypothetical protein ALC57_06759 [Trachymyrmex cornetzi]
MHTLAFASGKSSYDKRNNTRITAGAGVVSGAARCPLQGITPLALTQSGSEAYLAIERIQGYNLTWKRIAARFMYQEDGGSGRLSPSGQSMGSSIKFTLQKTRLPRHAAATTVAGRGFPSL